MKSAAVKTTTTHSKPAPVSSATPLAIQSGGEIQCYGEVVPMPIGLEESVTKQSVENLNLVLANTITLKELYKKHHWQVSGPTFYSLHLLFDKHYAEQDALVDMIAERIMLLGGISLAMGGHVADVSTIPCPPRGREEVPVQISRLLHAHEILLKESRQFAKEAADAGDDGTNDLLVSNVVRTNELQVWFLAEHVVDSPLVRAQTPSNGDCAVV